MYNYLRLLQLRRGYAAADTGAQGGAQFGAERKYDAAYPGTEEAGAQGTGEAGQGPSGAEGTGEAPGVSTGGQGEGDAEPPKTFSQADVDRIIARENAKWKRQQEKAIETARTEAEKLASMSAEQRAQAEREKREAELSKREAEITRRELHAQALETLAQRGLPRELAKALNYADADACGTSIDAVEKAFRSAVQKGVEERLRGNAPRTGAGAAKADYARLAQEASGRGDFTAAAYYTRLAGEQKGA